MEDNAKINITPNNPVQQPRSQSLHVLGIIFLIVLFFGIVSCSISDNSTTNNTLKNETSLTEFFGDSLLTIVSSNRPNGYLVKIFQTKDLVLLNLTRGDSINQYVTIFYIPSSVKDAFPDLDDGCYPDSIGSYIREINIPIVKELGSGLFFMDVNFDGEEELVVEHPGYNRMYYDCFDIVHGVANVTPGILHPMKEPPYNDIVSGEFGSTEFDFDKKTIHISESIGCSNHIETWCEMVSDYEFDSPKLQVVKKEEVEIEADDNGEFYRVTTLYKRVDGALTKISTTREIL